MDDRRHVSQLRTANLFFSLCLRGPGESGAYYTTGLGANRLRPRASKIWVCSADILESLKVSRFWPAPEGRPGGRGQISATSRMSFSKWKRRGMLISIPF